MGGDMNSATKALVENVSLESIITSLGHSAISFGLRLLAAIFIFSVGIWLANRVTKSMARVMERRKVDLSLRSFTLSFVNILMKIFVVVIVLTTVGVQMTSIVAVLGAASLAIGMALSGSLQNVAGGIIILFFKPFRVGDTIKTASGDSGVVKRILIFTTELHTFDNQVVFLPNGALSGGVITNLSRGTNRRTDLSVGIAYGDNVAAARLAILQVLTRDVRVLQNPQPSVFVSSLGDSAVNLTVRYWTKYADQASCNADILEQIYIALPKKKINFPFPQLDVHVVK